MKDDDLKKKMFLSIMQKQLSYMLGRQQIFLELNDDIEESDELTEIMSNAPLNGAFLSLAREVGCSVSYCNISICWVRTVGLFSEILWIEWLTTIWSFLAGWRKDLSLVQC